jgi:hypothetical protein
VQFLGGVRDVVVGLGVWQTSGIEELLAVEVQI